MQSTVNIDNDVPLPEDGWITAVEKRTKPLPPKIIAESTWKPQSEVAGSWVEQRFNPPQPGPDDCTFIGGPLNGKFGPLRDNKPRVVEIEIYNPDGSVASVELYSLGDMHPTPTFRYHVGSKQP